MPTTVSSVTWVTPIEELIDVQMDVMTATVIFLVPLEGTSIVQTARGLSEVQLFDKHKLIKSNQKKSICQLVYNCDKCGIRIIGNKKKHACPGQRKCKFCKEIVGPGHQCYIQKYQCKNQPNSEDEDEEEEQKSEQTSPRFIFYDFELSQETGEHKVNFCVVQTVIIVWIYPRMNIAQPAVHYVEEEG